MLYHNAALVSILVDCNTILNIGTTQNDAIDDKFPYRKVMSKLQFASIGIHPDITYVVSMATKFSSTFKKIQYNVIHKI